MTHTRRTSNMSYLDKGHWEVLCEIGPADPIPQQIRSPSAVFRSTIIHKDPEEIDDDQGPEVLDGADIEEGDGCHGKRRDPEQDSSSLHPPLYGETERGKDGHSRKTTPTKSWFG